MSASTIPSLSTHTARRPIRIWPLLMAAVAFRLWYAGYRQLVPDEAFYWLLSRHLQLGYLDHPPLLAVLIRFTTWLLGSTEVGVRLVAIAFGFGTLILLLRLAETLFGDRRALLFLTILWLVSPLFHGLAGIVTPDTPAIFFSLCGLACGLSIALKLEQPEAPAADASASPPTARPWLALGVVSGLAMLSKYTTVLLPGSIIFAMIAHPRGRRELLRPWPYLAAITTLAIFSPVIYWNATHEWASFKYQLHHGLNAGAKVNHWKNFGEYVGVQILFFTPVLFVLIAGVTIASWTRYRTLRLQGQVLLWAGSLPLLFFGYAATRSHGEANWPAFGYFPLSLLLAEYLMQQDWRGAAMKWAKIGCAVALGITIVMHAPELLYSTHVVRELPRKLNEMFGWREMGQTIFKVGGRIPIVCNTHEDAGEASFYTPGQPTAWCVSLGANSRPTSFDYLPGGPDLYHVRAVLLVGGNTEAFCAKYGFKVADQTHWVIKLHGHERDRQMVICERRE